MSGFDDIADLVIASDSVEYGGKSYQVWGLTTPHIIHLVRSHGPSLSPLYLQATAGNLPADLAEVALRLGEDFSSVAGDVIACGMGKPDQASKCAKLPFAVQLDALDKIIRLTLEVEGGLGKVVEIVSRAAQDIKPLLPRKT